MRVSLFQWCGGVVVVRGVLKHTSHKPHLATRHPYGGRCQQA
jgi:hypothetical protein